MQPEGIRVGDHENRRPGIDDGAWYGVTAEDEAAQHRLEVDVTGRAVNVEVGECGVRSLDFRLGLGECGSGGALVDASAFDFLLRNRLEREQSLGAFS